MLFKREAALLCMVVVGVTWVKCTGDIEPYGALELKDHSCGLAVQTAPCCPNLKDKVTAGITVSPEYKGGDDSCRCRCSEELPATAGTSNTILKVGESGKEKHYYCKAGYGEATLAPAEGENGNGGGGGDASKSGASILQLCKVLVFAALMAAGTIVLISYE